MSLSTADRVIRVFVSSTFRDMKRERDLLVKKVFPELRRLCAQRFVTFTEVDLRWGITEEQAREGQVLPLCLAEIERSRPYFIGLLGERYGSLPDDFQPPLLAQQPWLQDHAQRRTSVTELEMLHGVLRDPTMDGHAYFYFRDPAYLNHLPPDDKSADHQSENDAARTKLDALKEKILAARDKGTCVCHENYPDPQTVADWILADFTALLNRLYPEADVPSSLVRERLGHEAHAKHKLYACIDRPEHQAALRAYAARTDRHGKGLVVTGDSGSGKTALLAAWARDWAQSHPDHPDQEDQPADFVFQHYFGASPSSTSPDGFVRRLLGELKQRFNLPDEIPTGSDKMCEALPLWLAQTMGKGRIVLVLDGLNQVQGSDAQRRLNFLPRSFPPHVTVLASSLPGPALDTLRERGWAEHNLPLADRSEIDAMVGEYFRIHARHVDVEGRPLDTPLRRQLVAAPGSKNPLFLRTLLEELRQIGSFEKLPEGVAYYLQADTPQDLFQRVIARWQEDFDIHDRLREAGEPGLVHRALTHLWAARQGLSEAEWLDLLGSGDEPLPRASWSPLFLALEPHLSQRSGLFAFGHDFLRQTVATEFVPATDEERAAHRAVADYFTRQPVTARSCDELPWQLWQAEERDRLRECMLEIDRFLEIHNRDQEELMRYWVWLREERSMGNTYVIAYEKWSFGLGKLGSTVPSGFELSSFVHHVGYAGNELAKFLQYSGLFAEAEPICRRALEIAEQGNGPAGVVGSRLNNLGALLLAQNRSSEAEYYLRRALLICEQTRDKQHVDTARAINNLAQTLQDQGRRAEAETLMRQALSIWEKNRGPIHPDVASALNNLAGLLIEAGRMVEAESLCRRALAINEQYYGPDHPEVGLSLSNLGNVLREMNAMDEAELLMRRALVIEEKQFGPDHPRVAKILGSLGQLLQARNKLNEAEPHLSRTAAILEASLGERHAEVATAWNNLAALLRQLKRLPEAERLLRRTVAMDKLREVPDHPDLATHHCNLADVLSDMRQFSEAEVHYRSALRILDGNTFPNPMSLATVLNNLSQLCKATDRLPEAVSLVCRALEAWKSSLGDEHPYFLIGLKNLWGLLNGMGQRSEAEPVGQCLLTILLRLSSNTGRNHPDLEEWVNHYARLLEDLGYSEEHVRHALCELMQPFGIGLSVLPTSSPN